jgi:UDP-N-acetylmuramate: L-alanyl-gamma-D-glutamyl-meso-diaminopimelate ligase
VSENPERIHFVAIAGTGMGSLAGLLKARGLSVTGSDDKLYPPMSTALEQWGIPVHEGFRADHVLDARPDLVVIGNAVRADNIEARAAIDEGFEYLSFSDALYELAIAGKHPIVISGTHGKTTTTSITAQVLHGCGRDPSMLVGGFALDFDGNFLEGQGEHFIVEGDEYDTAFWDKTPKFLHYHPRTLVITSVEFDHADIYTDLDHIKSAFRKLVAGMPEDGVIVAATVHDDVRDVVSEAPCQVVPYGVGTSNASGQRGFRARALEPGPRGTHFDLLRNGEFVCRALTPLYGREGVENSVAALAVADAVGIPMEEAVAALERFRGVKRRMEIRGDAGGVTVVDDFAHHPTAVRATLAAARARFPGRRTLAIFEPRTNTSRRTIFQDDYGRAFGDADRTFLRVVPDTPIYSNTGEVTERLDAYQLADTISEAGGNAIAVDGVDTLVERIVSEARPGDVALVMSNGDFEGIHDKLLEALGAAS